MTAKQVHNPGVNVGRSSLIGTALSAVLYVLVTTAVAGLVEPSRDTRPDAVRY